MSNQEVLDVLNELEVIESENEHYALVENNQKSHDMLNKVGVSSETINSYEENGTFCIYLLALSEEYANFIHNDKFVTFDNKTEMVTERGSIVYMFEIDGDFIIAVSNDGGLTFDIQGIPNEEINRL